MNKDKNKVIKRVRKKIPDKTTIKIWVKSGGRCQYVSCNKALWRDDLTKRDMNKGYISHIVAASEKGPRGEKGKSKELEIEFENLMLLCDECHNRIDKAQVHEHPKELLLEMKQNHEQRIEMATSISANRKSNIIIYTANIGKFEPNVTFMDCATAMKPHNFPSSDIPIRLGINRGVFTDDEKEYWKIQEHQLMQSFISKVNPFLENSEARFSIFGLAPQSLLIKLGTLLSELSKCEVYQFHRTPDQSWEWPESNSPVEIILNAPDKIKSKVVLLVSLSDNVALDRIQKVLGDDIAIWEITSEDPNRNILNSKATLENFKNRARDAFSDIKNRCGMDEEIHVFPVMPNSCAIELGRVWMPKADLPLKIYDQNKETQGFNQTITIN